MTPLTGYWGTEVTIDGENFGAVAGTGSVQVAGTGANGFVLDTWNDTEITGRIAFPATGMFSIQTGNGEVDAWPFTTMDPYVPSSSLDVSQLVEALAVSTGDVAGLYQEYELTNEPTLAVFSGSAAGAYPIDDLVDTATPSAPMIARLVEADDQTPEVIATKPDGTIAAFAIQGSSIAATATGLTGTVVAAARDATGVYAWIATASGVERVRPGAPWTVDRGPFVPADAPLDGAIAADGTLWIAVSEPAGTNLAYVSLQVLSPAASAFSALERADPTSYADEISQAHIILAPDGVHAVVLATADAGGTPTSLTPRQRTAAATWSAAPTMSGLVQYGFIGATLGAIVNDATAKTTSLVPDVTMPAGAQVIPVWPMQSEGFVVDSADQAHPLITNGSVRYALTPPM